VQSKLQAIAKQSEAIAKHFQNQLRNDCKASTKLLQRDHKAIASQNASDCRTIFKIVKRLNSIAKRFAK
jgi:hypothetical protein